MNGSLRWKVILGVVLAFLAGGASGFFCAAFYARHVMVEFHHPGMASARMKEHLRRQLDLTAEQEAKISPIADKMAGQLEQIRKETGQRVRHTFEDAHKEIAEFLTPEQKTRLAEMEKRHRSMRMEMRHGGHHGPPADDGGPPPPGPPEP